MEEMFLIGILLVGNQQDSHFTLNPMCVEDKYFELRDDFKWAKKSPMPETVILIQRGCDYKTNPRCPSKECVLQPDQKKQKQLQGEQS